MTLNEYLQAHGLTQTDFAARLSRRLGDTVPPQSMSRWAKPAGSPGFVVPNPNVVVAIHRETKGEVPVESWYGHMLPAKRAAAR